MTMPSQPLHRAADLVVRRAGASASTGEDAGTVSATNPADEYEALVYVVDRMARRFPAIGEEALFELVADEWTRFDQARFRDYVPVLVEGNVLRRLRGARPVVPTTSVRRASAPGQDALSGRPSIDPLTIPRRAQ